jgi:hypothetical protein
MSDANPMTDLLGFPPPSRFGRSTLSDLRRDGGRDTPVVGG